MNEVGILPELQQPLRLDSNAYTLTVRQQPERAKAFSGSKEKDRKPVDPPPIVQLQITDPSDPAQNYLQSPYFFMCCSLVDHDLSRPGNLSAGHLGADPETASESALVGVLVSSLHRLKDTNNTDSGFFVFPDISVRVEGKFRLRFSLFEMIKEPTPNVIYVKSVVSSILQVYNAKTFPGMLESTFLSRSFSDQGVRLRVRKEPRILGKRPAQTELPASQTSSSSSRTVPKTERSDTQRVIEQPSDLPITYRDPSSGTSQHLDPYAYYASRDPSSNRHFYSQGSQQAPVYGIEYPYGQPRADGVPLVSPSVPQPAGWGNYAATPMQNNAHYHMRDASGQYPLAGPANPNTRHPQSFVQPVPVDRQLSSSAAGQADFSRSFGSSDSPTSYGMPSAYDQSYDSRMHAIPNPTATPQSQQQGYLPAGQEQYTDSSSTSRSLPPPADQTQHNQSYRGGPRPGMPGQPSSNQPTTGSNYATGVPQYPYGSYHGNQQSSYR